MESLAISPPEESKQFLDGEGESGQGTLICELSALLTISFFFSPPLSIHLKLCSLFELLPR